jgi:hypothetical protein
VKLQALEDAVEEVTLYRLLEQGLKGIMVELDIIQMEELAEVALGVLEVRLLVPTLQALEELESYIMALITAAEVEVHPITEQDLDILEQVE